MKIEVGSYEAKTKLPELLRGVSAGNSYTITLHGKAVANLVPVEGSNTAAGSDAVDRMLAFMASGPRVKGLDVKALKDEGRA